MSVFAVVVIILGVLCFIGIVTSYILLAAARHADLECCGDHAETPFPYEAGVAYIVWAILCSIVSYGLDTYGSPLMEMQSLWFGVGVLCLMFFSYILVHLGCMKIGRKFPRLREYEWLR